jgi:hypothetical protein
LGISVNDPLKKMCNRMKILRPAGRGGYRSTPPDRREKFLVRTNGSHHGRRESDLNTIGCPIVMPEEAERYGRFSLSRRQRRWYLSAKASGPSRPV